MDIKNSSLNLRHSIRLLFALKEKGGSNITDLQSKDIVSNYRTLKSLVDELEKDGFIKKEISEKERLTIHVTLDKMGEKIVNFLETLEKESKN